MTMSNEVVLVTGGQGFIGQHLVTRLQSEDFSVVEYNRDAEETHQPHHHCIRGDLRDGARLTTVLKEYAVDVVVHTAGQSHPTISLSDPWGTMEANVMGTTTLLEACRVSPIRRLILFSSECAYGECLEKVVEESHPLHPTTPYGVSKATVDWLAQVYRQQWGLDVMSLRVSQVYGPGQRLREDIQEILRAAVLGRPLVLERGADQVVQLVYVGDVVEAVMRAIGVSSHQETVYHVTGGTQVTLGEVVALVKQLLDDVNITIGPGDLGYDRQGLFSLARAQEELGYQPSVDLTQGIVEYLEWLRTHQY